MEILQQAGAVLIVFALLGALMWLRGRRGTIALPFSRPARRDRRLLESVDRIPLSPSHVLHLIRLGDRSLLVAVDSRGCVLLDARPWAELERSEWETAAPKGVL